MSRFPVRHLAGQSINARFVGLLLLATVVLVGCQTLEPSPTPTATRTPILPTSTPTPPPTATPLPTSTPTLTPSPTLPPDLILPPTATEIDTCPPLPTDLYFLAEGELRVCLAEGRTMDRIAASPDARSQTIIDYRVTPDQRRIAYVTDAGELFVLDRALLQHTLLPTAGRLIDDTGIYFEITVDGTTVVYLAWGVQTARGPAIEDAKSGAILAISVDSPKQLQQEIGFCRGLPGRPCRGFQLSPDEAWIAAVDANGISLIDRTAPEPPRLLGHAEAEAEAVQLRAWSPDSAWLLLESLTDVDPALTLLSVGAEDLPIRQTPLCSAPCELGIGWMPPDAGSGELWVSWDTSEQGCVARISPVASESALHSLQPVSPTCQTATFPLHPVSPAAAPPGVDLAFLQGGIAQLADGIYGLTSDAELVPIAILPGESGPADSIGSLLWSGSGNAFLHLDRDGAASHLGVIDPPAFWLVKDLLLGASDFRWATARP